jgi:hypothetical protein
MFDSPSPARVWTAVIVGGAMLTGAIASRVLNAIQALDYLQLHSPSAYSIMVSNKTLLILIIGAVLLFLFALKEAIGLRAPRDEAGKTAKKAPLPAPSANIPKIEDDPDVNALNIRITNDIDKGGLNDCILYLHRRILVDRKSRTPLPSFQVMRLTSNHHNIPYLEERRYQLLEFTNPVQPFFRGYGGTVNLPEMGLWRLDMELTWYGGEQYQFSKCFMWEAGRTPYFVNCPTGSTVEEKQTKDDPRVYLSVEERQVGRFQSDTRNVFVATNQGGSEARNIRIEFPLVVGGMVFDSVDVLASGDKTDMVPEVIGERWPTAKHDIFTALNKQPFSLEEIGEAKEYPFTLIYENHNLARTFECPAILVYRSLHESFKRINNMSMNDEKKIAEVKHGDCKGRTL